MRAIRRDDDEGSAVVEFALVAPLILLIALAVIQVALALYVRATLTSAAAEGARAAALAGADSAAGVRRAHALLAQNISRSTVRHISGGVTTVGGVTVMAVRIDATLPLVGLLGPTTMTVVGHALQEAA